MTDIKTVGFIGIGNMGAPMAANVKRGGFEVVAFDLDPARAKKWAQENGARSTDQLAELGKLSDAIVTMLPTGKEVREALFTMQGGALAANLKAGAFVIDMSSADPVATRALGSFLYGISATDPLTFAAVVVAIAVAALGACWRPARCR